MGRNLKQTLKKVSVVSADSPDGKIGIILKSLNYPLKAGKRCL